MALRTIEIGGKKRPISVGVAMTNYYCKGNGRNWTIRQFSDAFSDKRLKSMDFQIDEIIELIYYALYTGAKATGKEVDFTQEDVLFWVDEAGMGVAGEVLSAMGDDVVNGKEPKKKKQATST